MRTDGWGAAPSQMSASTWEGVYIAAEAIERAGTVDKNEVRDALAELEMPQLLALMKGGVISFSPDSERESKFECSSCGCDMTQGRCEAARLWFLW